MKEELKSEIINSVGLFDGYKLIHTFVIFGVEDDGIIVKPEMISIPASSIKNINGFLIKLGALSRYGNSFTGRIFPFSIKDHRINIDTMARLDNYNRNINGYIIDPYIFDETILKNQSWRQSLESAHNELKHYQTATEILEELALKDKVSNELKSMQPVVLAQTMLPVIEAEHYELQLCQTGTEIFERPSLKDKACNEPKSMQPALPAQEMLPALYNTKSAQKMFPALYNTKPEPKMLPALYNTKTSTFSYKKWLENSFLGVKSLENSFLGVKKEQANIQPTNTVKTEKKFVHTTSQYGARYTKFQTPKPSIPTTVSPTNTISFKKAGPGCSIS